ncbi:ATP-binding protein [Emticicia soli]|uniref:histidine kinase n=1 Tax=Emticicia soli TaxID=2027878 RepID=A0ABW5J5D4_9BACT
MPRILFAVIASIIILLSCSENKTNDLLYQKPSEEVLDQYSTYLSDERNFQDSTYLPFFYNRYYQLITENKIDSAAQVVFWAGKTISRNYKYNAAFERLTLDFVSKYGSQIPKRYYSGIYTNIGNTYCDNGKFDSCAYYLNKGLVEPEDYYTYQNIATLNYNLIFAYLNTGKLEHSLKSAFDGLEMFEKQNDSTFQAATYSGIACIYRYQDDYPEAEKYENKGFEIVKQTKDTNVLLVVSLNKISLYSQMDHPNLYPFIDSTMNVYRQWSKKTEEKTLSIKSWYAFKLVRENKLAEAKKILDNIKPLTLSMSDYTTLDYYYNAATEYDLKAGKPSEEVDFYIGKIPEFKENEDYLRLVLFNQILHDDALVKGDYKAAREYLAAQKIAQDSLSNRNLRIKVKELDKKYQTEKKEQQIALQEKEITQKNTFIALLIMSLVGILAAIVAYYLWQRQKTLKQEKEVSMNFTKQLLESTEEERKRIAGDLHDSISHELLALKTTLSQDIKVVSSKIDTIINDIRGISRNLHPVMFDKIGLIPNIEQLIERIQNQNNFFISTELNYSGSLSSANELQIYRVIQEALSNIIKYANAHAAKITIEEQASRILVEIKDNGKGFNVKEAITSGKAFGLHNIIERSRVIGGEAQINSSAEGTVITINIPTKI